MSTAPQSPPSQIGGAEVLYFTVIDERHRFTGACVQKVGGEVVGPLSRLAITKYAEGRGVYLFGCDLDWHSITDTFHDSVEEAMDQAEFEYRGTRATWVKIQRL